MLCYHVKMLPTEQGEFAMSILLLQDEGSPARSVFLSRYSRARCNVPSKVLAIAHATMTLFPQFYSKNGSAKTRQNVTNF